MDNPTLTKFKVQIEDLKNTFREFGNIINAAEELYDHLNMDRSNLEEIERKIKYIESSSENMEILFQLSDKYMEQRLDFDEEISTLDKITFMNEDSLDKIRLSMLEVTDDEGHQIFNRLLRDRFSRVARQQEVLELLRDVESSWLHWKADHIVDSNDDDLIIVSDKAVSKPTNNRTNNSSSKDWEPTSQSIPRKLHRDLEIDDDDDEEEEIIPNEHFTRVRENNNNNMSRRSIGGTLQFLNQKSQQQQLHYGELDLEELEKLRSSMPEREFNKLYEELTSYPRETRSSAATTQKLQQKSVNNYFRRKRHADDWVDEGNEENLTKTYLQKRDRRANMRNPYKGTDLENFIVNDEEEDEEYDANICNSSDEQDNFSRKRKKHSHKMNNPVSIRHSEDENFEPTANVIDGFISSEDVDEARRHQKKAKTIRKKKLLSTKNGKNNAENKDHMPPSAEKSKLSKRQQQLTLEDTSPSVQSLTLPSTHSHFNMSAHANMRNGMSNLDDDDDDDDANLAMDQPDSIIPVQITTPPVRHTRHLPLSPSHSAASSATAQHNQAPKQQHPIPFKSPRIPPSLESENINNNNNNNYNKSELNPSKTNKSDTNRSPPMRKHMHAGNDINVQLQLLRKKGSEMFHSLTAASTASTVKDMYSDYDTPPDTPVHKLSMGNKNDKTNTNNMQNTHFEPIDLT